MTWTRLRRALGIVREDDPGAWQCYAGHWNTGPQCYQHNLRVFGPPTTPRPPLSPPMPSMPPRVVYVVLASTQPVGEDGL